MNNRHANQHRLSPEVLEITKDMSAAELMELVRHLDRITTEIRANLVTQTIFLPPVGPAPRWRRN